MKFVNGMSAGMLLSLAMLLYFKPAVQPVKEVVPVKEITLVVKHIKTTKNTEVYGPDPMDATAPLINSIYLQKVAVGTPAPTSLQLTLTPVKE